MRFKRSQAIENNLQIPALELDSNSRIVAVHAFLKSFEMRFWMPLLCSYAKSMVKCHGAAESGTNSQQMTSHDRPV